MVYTRTNWENKPSTATPINAARLNNIESGVVDAHAQLDGPIAARASAATKRQAPPHMGDGTVSNPAFTDIVGMLPDGRRKVFTGPTPNAAQIGVSEDGEAFTWGENFGSANLVTGVISTPGGEVLVAVKALDNSTPGTVSRSTGWDPSNADATSWATVLTASKNGAHMDGRWCLTERSVAPLNSPGAGAIFLCEYDGDRAWMSTDDGVTWTQIFDLQTARPGAHHVHAIAYDRWDDRVWVTVGDNTFAGIYYVDRANISGTSTPWTLLPDSYSGAWQATTIVPLSNAVVFLSDASDSGVFSVLRDGVRGYKQLRNAVDLPDAGLIGAHAYQAADDLPAFLTFYQSGSGQTPCIIATIDGEHFSTVYTDTEVVSGSAPGIHSIVGPDLDGNVWAVRNLTGSGALLSAPTAPPEESPIHVGPDAPTATPGVMWLEAGTGTLFRYDERMGQWIPAGVGSPAWGGESEALTLGTDANANQYASIAIGHDATADGYASIAVGQSAIGHDSSAVAIGNGAEAQGSRNVAIGVDATAGDPATTWDSGAVALGSGAQAHGNSSVALGDDSKTWDAEAAALGNGAAAGRTGVAIGYNSKAGADYSSALAGAETAIAIGSSANASSLRAMAIGTNSQATHEQSVALGAGSYANGDDAIAIGNASATAARSIAIGNGASTYVADQAVIGAHELVVKPRYDEIGNETTPGIATSVVLYSPNGSQWRITVDDTGTLGATAVV